MKDVQKQFDSLISDVQACTACARMCGSKRVLNRGCGPIDAEILVVGEAPGRLGADASQIPFHGDKAGHNFESLIELSGLRRDQLFVTNAALCNPKNESGNNSTPLESELAACSIHLKRQIDLVQPKIVVTLGAVALRALSYIEPHRLELRKSVRTSTQWYGRELIPLYHPGQRAMIHRSFANQLSDYNFLAEHARRLQKPRRTALGASRRDIAILAKAILECGGPRTYFSLHKLCYLTELRFATQERARLTGGYYIRQKDGPYCVDLNLQRLRRAGLEIKCSTHAGVPWVSVDSPHLFASEAPEHLDDVGHRVLTEVMRRYGQLPDDRLKTAVYLTKPMRSILRREKQGSNQLNAPISFDDFIAA